MQRLQPIKHLVAMRWISLTSSAITLSACAKTEVQTPQLTECLENIIDLYASIDTSEPLVRINAQKVGGEDWYWLITESRVADRAEYVLAAHCDTVCTWGYYRPQDLDCMQGVDAQGWRQIWPAD